MKKIGILISILFAAVLIQAQDYMINFSGSGESNTVGSVKIENLTQGKSLTLKGTEVLHLMGIVTGINPILDQGNSLLIYPNPMMDNSQISFNSTTSGLATIELFDKTGKLVGKAQNIITQGRQSYRLSNLRSGIYTVRVSTQSYSYTGKLICKGNSNSAARINYLENSIIPITAMKLKSASDEKIMQYTNGDRLKITGISGNYSTVIVDVPTKSKSIIFPFVSCTDADGNNYPVVKIGTQLWMAENLKTTKYKDDTDIPNVVVSTEWNKLNSSSYCWYDNNVTNKNTYGALYNWYAVNSGKLAPSGWHVPSDTEWTSLINYLGGQDVGGGKLKEVGTNQWLNPNLSANNESGYCSIPSGGRGMDGKFIGMGEFNYLWSLSFNNSNESWSYGIYYLTSDISKGSSNVLNGLSVRCIKD